jgi:hypothetical protein
MPNTNDAHLVCAWFVGAINRGHEKRGYATRRHLSQGRLTNSPPARRGRFPSTSTQLDRGAEIAATRSRHCLAFVKAVGSKRAGDWARAFGVWELQDMPDQSMPKDVAPGDVALAPGERIYEDIYKRLLSEVCARIDQRIAAIEAQTAVSEPVDGGELAAVVEEPVSLRRSARRRPLLRVAIGLAASAGPCGPPPSGSMPPFSQFVRGFRRRAQPAGLRHRLHRARLMSRRRTVDHRHQLRQHLP